MTPEQSIEILNQATDPRKSGQLTRGDYAMIEQALLILSKFVKEKQEKPSGEADAAK